MILAIFGDIHGNLKDMYGLGIRWQQQNARSIDLVLQTGDFGVWHDQSILDRATVRWIERDPTERACADYIAGRERASIRTVFVAGNHEDFDFLAEHRSQPIDPFGMITYLDSGSTFKLQKGAETIRIAGLGGIFPQGVKHQNRERHLGRKYFSSQAVKQLMSLGSGTVDILLTHEAPAGKGLVNQPGTGAEQITQLINHLQPHYAFWGHYGNPPPPFYTGRTRCVCMNQPNCIRVPRRDGGMGIVDTQNWSFILVSGFARETTGPPHSVEKSS